MRHRFAPAAGLFLCLTALIGARQDRGSDLPQFRAGVELIQLDVSVLDRDRRPVRGLTAVDFTVLVDGQVRPVSAFKSVELTRPAAPPGALWMKDVAPDVVTNARPAGRVVAIVIDDGSLNAPDVADLFAVRKMRELGRAAVDELADNDLAAVVFTENSHRSQNFTTDRQLLFGAIEKAPLLPSPAANLGFFRGAQTNGLVTVETGDPFGINRPSCDCGACSIETLGRIADGLLALPEQRKVIVFISAGVRVDPQVSVPYSAEGNNYAYRAEHCNVRKQRALADVYRRAGLANVTIQSLDARGLIATDRAPTLAEIGAIDTNGGIDLRVEFLRGIAEQTGGRAVVRNNDMEREVRPLIEETSFYYLLGVEAPTVKDDGRLHQIKVSTARPGVEVRTRRGYFAPTPEERRRMVATETGDAEAAMTGPLPKADVPLEINVLPFADPKAPEGSSLAVIVGVTQPNGVRGMARSERVRIVTTAYNPETGQSVGSQQHELDLQWNATGQETGRFEVLSRLPLKPGRYEVRVGVEAGDGRTGSVYTYAEVPDFQKNALSLSGLVLNVTPTPRAVPVDAFRDVIPLTPTARRTFRRTDRVTAWLRFYRPKDAAGTITTRLTSADNDVIAELTQVIDNASGGDSATGEHRIDLPVEDLTPGEYLVTVEVSAGNNRARRDARFRIQ